MLIRQFRNDAGLSQQDMADLTGLDQATISRIENGHQRVTVDQLRLFSEALGVTMAALLDEREAA